MLTLLAESKTMSAQQRPVDASELAAHTPVFQEQASLIMDNIQQMSVAEIASRMGISSQLASKARELAFDFPHSLTGYEAIFGFTGEAFRGLEAGSLSADALEKAKNELKFISSVYGILNSHDIIKPYRSEFSKPVAPEGKTSIQYYKPKVTIEMAKLLKNTGPVDVINLLPADADKCLDWKLLRAFAKVHKVVFQVPDNKGGLKTPLAKRLKELRGIMARTILMDDIKSFKELTEFESPHFIFSPQHSKPLLPVFIAD